MVERLVPLGEIVATHGLDGWLKLNPFNPQTPRLAAGRAVVLEKADECFSHELEAGKPHKHQFLIKLKSVDTIDAATRWIGATLTIPETELETPEPGEYYLYQAIGLEVVDLQGRSIGTVTDVLPTAGAGLYVVRGPSKEHLIPAVRDIIEKIDFDTGRMTVNLPEGLLDL